ncbi:uncharacterized protein LOC114867987 isoform X2 [Betta splendens]|uniref:Uncharacterized protein LOC114867987 isoform X2 n=1 Tax=Betta splendens TaxID=158456 RepID=A0A9W2Y898_BETSP|nr:uncharacterized protein LOC114867987 isoform X2 [Betta splendens]
MKPSTDGADDFSPVSASQTDELAAESVNDKDHNNPFNIDRPDAADKEVKSTLSNNHLSQLGGHNERSTQPTHRTEQAQPLLPVPSDLASFEPDPNDGAESAAFPEPDDLVPEMPQINANYAMTRAYLEAGSVAAEIPGRQNVGDSAVAVPQSGSRSDLKVSNTSTQQPGNQVSDAASELQIITTTDNDFVSLAARIDGPKPRESQELELTSEKATGKSFPVGRAERRVWINRTSGPGHRTSAPPGAPAATHPVTVHRFNGGPQDGKHAEPGKGTPPSAKVSGAAVSPVTRTSDVATVDRFTRENATRTTDKPSAKTLGAFVDVGRLTRETAEKTRQRRSHTEAQRFNTTEATLLDWTPLTETNGETQTRVGAEEGDGAQSAVRSVNATPVQESGRRLLLEPGPEPELPALKHRRRTPPHLYLSGVTEVTEDLCGSGNYTAEMSLNLGRDVEPGDAVPVLGNLRVSINLKTNSSLINLEVTSCCLSPTVQPDLTSSTCCLFSRLAAEPVGITLLPSALSTSASFTISLFQMINYSAVYLHCDLSVCLRNRSDCERECPERRSAFPAEGPDAIVTNLRNRISFGPMLKEVRNATFLEEIVCTDPTCDQYDASSCGCCSVSPLG